MGGNALAFMTGKSGQLDGRSKSVMKSHIAKKGHRERQEQQLQRLAAQWWRQLQQANSSLTQSFPGDDWEEERSQFQTQSWSVLWRGNSDPFSSQLIEIDAKVNRYIEIGYTELDNITWGNGYRAIGAPRGFPSRKAVDVGAPPVRYIYGAQLEPVSANSINDSLSMHAYATLAHVAGALFALNKSRDDQRNAFMFSAQCTSLIRKYVQQGALKTTPRLQEAILRLIKAEVMTGSFKAASVHVKFLEDWALEQAKRGELDRGYLSRLLFTSNNLAVAFWRAPTFTSSWLEEMFDLGWMSLTTNDIATKALALQLNYHIAQSELRRLLAAVKILFVETQEVLAGRVAITLDHEYWLVAREQWLHLRLFNFIFSHFEYYESLGSDTPIPIILDLAAAITTVLVLRSHFDQRNFGGQPLFPQSRILLEKMTLLLPRLSSLTTWKDRIRYNPMLLWITFVASLVEHRYRSILSRHARYGLWRQRLVQALSDQQIESWEELQQILYLFPYVEGEFSIPSPEWLDELFVGG